MNEIVDSSTAQVLVEAQEKPAPTPRPKKAAPKGGAEEQEGQVDGGIHGCLRARLRVSGGARERA